MKLELREPQLSMTPNWGTFLGPFWVVPQKPWGTVDGSLQSSPIPGAVEAEASAVSEAVPASESMVTWW